MVNYLLDTNVLSEATRAKPDACVAEWLSRRSSGSCYISVISTAEIRKGMLLLPRGKKRQELEAWFTGELLPAFEERLLTLGEDEMSVWATLQADAEKAGHRLPAMDSLIAATARCHGLTLVTRNTDDFRHCGIPVLNPWNLKKG